MQLVPAIAIGATPIQHTLTTVSMPLAACHTASSASASLPRGKLASTTQDNTRSPQHAGSIVPAADILHHPGYGVVRLEMCAKIARQRGEDLYISK
jgi:hypothetical protein